jgi:hypothetical protein
MSKFIHFGCWNKGGCQLDPEFNDLSSVMNQLRLATTNYPTDFVLVAGDNYYPESRKNALNNKEKKIITEDLVTGLNCLPKNVPVHIILGNHDIEERVGVDEFLEINTNESQKCYILDVEKDFASRNPNMTFNLWNNLVFNEKTLVIMIDSTIYDVDVTDDPETSLLCYKHYYETSGILSESDVFNLERIKNDQRFYVEGVMSRMSDAIENIVIVAHHPITGYKTKKKGTDLMQFTAHGLSTLIYNSIYRRIPEERRRRINFYHLCADLHQYQIGTITINGDMTIKQYITGTGGTTLDPTPEMTPDKNEIIYVPNPHNESETIQIRYNMNTEQVQFAGAIHGFLECYSSERGLVFSFVTKNGERLTESEYSHFTLGGSRRFKRRRRHSIKRKLKSRKHNKKHSSKNIRRKKVKTVRFARKKSYSRK